MKAVSQQAKNHQRAVQRKTMARRSYRRYLQAIFTPEEMRRGRYANAHQQARRSLWLKSFGRASPIAAKIFDFLAKRAAERKARND